ncbi:hypothetical protein BGX21_008825 [Mortierella sp. AD011]|nr:hypothetical protein BGX20_009197 [Mortierella sp. AD010]KAF9402752.1 hypothetical protein BGX21_008825 [Mortierella sp. AD011]
MVGPQISTFTRENAQCMGPYKISKEGSPDLYLSAVEFSDIPEMVRLLNINQSVFNGSAIFQYPYFESHARERIQKAHDTIISTGVNTHWALRLESKSTSPLIGWAHLHFEHYDESKGQSPPIHPKTGRQVKAAEIGYWLSPEHTGKGYAGRMATFLVSEVVLKEMDCDIVRAVSYVDNMASRKVAEKTGMKLELERISIFVPKLGPGVQKDVCIYALHRDDATKEIVKENYDY